MLLSTALLKLWIIAKSWSARIMIQMISTRRRLLLVLKKGLLSNPTTTETSARTGTTKETVQRILWMTKTRSKQVRSIRPTATHMVAKASPTTVLLRPMTS